VGYSVSFRSGHRDDYLVLYSAACTIPLHTHVFGICHDASWRDSNTPVAFLNPLCSRRKFSNSGCPPSANNINTATTFT